MQCRYEQLPQQLNNHALAPIYLISGEEIVLIQAACNAIRLAAKKAGFTDRQVFYSDTHFNASSLIGCMNNYGLFGGGFDSTYGTHINFKASYLFLAPLFDIGMGRRQVFHIYAMPGMGILLNGQQSLRVYQTLNSVNQSDITSNTSQDIYRLIFRFNVGLIQHIQLSNYWHLTFNESVGAVNVLSDEKGTNGVPLRPNYYTLQVGLMKKYHRRQN